VKARVIGGGVMGLGIARELAGAGYQVELLEKGPRPGPEASRASAGMIGPQSEALQEDACFEATLHSRDLWPGYAAALEAECGLPTGFRKSGALHLAFGAAYEKRLEAKYLWQKKRAGVLERLEGEELARRFPGLAPRVSAAFLAHGDYLVDNELLVEALAASCQKRGVDLRYGVEAKPEAGDGITVLCAGAWSGALHPALQGMHPIKGQLLSFVPPQRLMPEMPVHAEFCYLVPRGKRLIVGATVETVGFDRSLTGEGIEWLLQNAFETMPDLRSCEVDRIWTGFRPGSPDSWPLLGRLDQGLYACCGHARRGILLLPLSVQALLRCIQDNGALPKEAAAFSLGRLGSSAHAV
jgi:glycine oxidase